jgi:hypothetical protein
MGNKNSLYSSSDIVKSCQVKENEMDIACRIWENDTCYVSRRKEPTRKTHIGKATPVTGREAHRVVRRRGFHIL